MKKIVIVIPIVLVFITLCSSRVVRYYAAETDSLRLLYARTVKEWPRPTIDSGVVWQEMQSLPAENAWVAGMSNPEVQLGYKLFFDPRLSNSNQISCSSCHDPDLAWGDGKVVSVGHDHLPGTRNTPSLLNLAAHKQFFWDGRSASLEDQAINPLATHHEMDMEVPLLPSKLQAIHGYDSLFKAVYKTKRITIDQVTAALAAFEKTLQSRKSRFDLFMQGKYNALNTEEIKGLHLFRTKARCMNCHNGQYLTDDQYHNIGLTYYKRKYEDLGLYKVTRKPEDVGKFRTPSLRDLAYTGPYMHNGLFPKLEGIINIYNSGMQIKPKPGMENDPLFPQTDKLMQPLDLLPDEKAALVAFLQAMSVQPFRMKRPVLPE